MYSALAICVILFWVVGMVTGAVSTLFLLHLEETHLYAPLRHFTSRVKSTVVKITSQIRHSSLKEVFQSLSRRGVTFVTHLLF